MAIFEIPIPAEADAQVRTTLVSFAWDDTVKVARRDDLLLVDLGSMSADLDRLAAVCGCQVRLSADGHPELEWRTLNADEEDG